MEELSFEVSQEKGAVSALRQTCPAGKTALARFVFGHGAGASMRHQHMQSLCDALADRGIETLRYNFPYMQKNNEKGSGRTDNLATCLATINGAFKLSAQLPPLPTYLAGHSFGGRMSSHYAAQETADLCGVVYFSFPLHPAGKPATKRAEHLGAVKVPQLFLSGTRDKLAELHLLTPVVEQLDQATLHLLDTADHSFKVLKRTRTSEESVYDEAARVAAEFITLTNQV